MARLNFLLDLILQGNMKEPKQPVRPCSVRGVLLGARHGTGAGSRERGTAVKKRLKFVMICMARPSPAWHARHRHDTPVTGVAIIYKYVSDFMYVHLCVGMYVSV